MPVPWGMIGEAAKGFAKSRVGIGAMAGAAYGMFSDQTGMVTGAFKGGIVGGLARGRVGIGGAIAGGLYGAISSNNSILGGAAMGTLLARGGAPFARKGLSSWNAARGFGYGMGGSVKAAGYGMYRQGRATAMRIGGAAKRGYNQFSALRAQKGGGLF